MTAMLLKLSDHGGSQGTQIFPSSVERHFFTRAREFSIPFLSDNFAFWYNPFAWPYVYSMPTPTSSGWHFVDLSTSTFKC
jgi:hypothetical protein